MREQTSTRNRKSAAAVVRRFDDQRWLLDNVIRTVGVEWDQPRLGHLNAAMGPESTADIQQIRQSVKRFSDIARAFAAAGKKRMGRAMAAADKGQQVTARDNFYMAAGFYASAQWPIYENSPQNLEYNALKRDAYTSYAQLADHRVEAVWLDVGKSRIPAWFHLPYNYKEGPIPALVSIPGMDGFKERTVSLYGDRWLNRGIAVLAIEAPGRYECPTLGVYGSMDGWARTGTAAYDWLAARPEVDGAKIAITGNSFGSFISTIAFATSSASPAARRAPPAWSPDTGRYSMTHPRPSGRASCTCAACLRNRSSTAFAAASRGRGRSRKFANLTGA